LDDFVPADHVCRVIDAFIEKLMMSGSLASKTHTPLERDDLVMIRATF
jgi:hypothetical protein